MLVQLCKFTKNNGAVPLKWMNFTVHRLYLNKAAKTNDNTSALAECRTADPGCLSQENDSQLGSLSDVF